MAITVAVAAKRAKRVQVTAKAMKLTIRYFGRFLAGLNRLRQEPQVGPPRGWVLGLPGVNPCLDGRVCDSASSLRGDLLAHGKVNSNWPHRGNRI